MTAAPAPDPDDEAVQDAYAAFIAEQFAGEVLINKDSILTAMESGKYWEAFLADLAARRR